MKRIASYKTRNQGHAKEKKIIILYILIQDNVSD